MSLTDCVPNQKSITRRQFFQALAPSFRVKDTPLTPDVPPFRDYIPQAPDINVDYWALFISGLVAAPLSYSYNDLQQFPISAQTCTLVCAARPTERIMTALWEGIRIIDLLPLAEHRSQARYANLFAANGYSTSLPVSALENALLAFKVSGQPLSKAQGFPARLIIPGHYAHKMPLWIRRISLGKTPVTSYWERHGHALDGEVRPTTAIFAPRQTRDNLIHLSGAAYAGKQAITQIHLSINNGDWRPIPFEAGSPFRWSRWSADWQPDLPGAYSLRVQAEDAQGRRSPIQEAGIEYPGRPR